ncbi:MAG: ligase [Labilithrix sp.]|nr:ligase [Labilithrix sp.]
MPRYEFSEGSSNKFWEITLDGTSFTTTYGRIGTDGQTSLKEFDSEEKAKKEYDKLIAEKTKKGYELVGGGTSAPKAAPAPAAAKPEKKDAAVFDDEGDDEEDAPKAKPAKAAAPAKPAAGGARYFEFVEGTSSKFWEIQLAGSSFTTRYGKIGTDGQQSLKEYASDALALKEYDKLVAEKTKKGYVEK